MVFNTSTPDKVGLRHCKRHLWHVKPLRQNRNMSK